MADGKVMMVALGAALVGFLAGSYAGRGSTRELESELERTRTELAAAKEQARAAAPLAMGLSRIFNGPGPVEPRPPLPGDDDAEAKDGDAATAQPSPGAAGNGESPPRPMAVTAPNSAERKQLLEQGAATWRIRAAQARAGFFEAGDLSDKQEAEFQKVVDTLNQEVKQVVQQAMEKINLENPERRDLVDLAVQVGHVYQDVDDDLRQVLTPEQITALNQSEFDILSQVDPDVVMPLLMQLDRPGGDGQAP